MSISSNMVRRNAYNKPSYPLMKNVTNINLFLTFGIVFGPLSKKLHTFIWNTNIATLHVEELYNNVINILLNVCIIYYSMVEQVYMYWARLMSTILFIAQTGVSAVSYLIYIWDFDIFQLVFKNTELYRFTPYSVAYVLLFIIISVIGLFSMSIIMVIYYQQLISKAYYRNRNKINFEFQLNDGPDMLIVKEWELKNAISLLHKSNSTLHSNPPREKYKTKRLRDRIKLPKIKSKNKIKRPNRQMSFSFRDFVVLNIFLFSCVSIIIEILATILIPIQLDAAIVRYSSVLQITILVTSTILASYSFVTILSKNFFKKQEENLQIHIIQTICFVSQCICSYYLYINFVQMKNYRSLQRTRGAIKKKNLKQSQLYLYKIVVYINDYCSPEKN
ncbi:hypothetical protein A3Q56_01230 [Intoshia linei]|uniref:Uncharacterized protein n=1 Tax=Intoshia linei TaxID=1819745 RepID=A0A177BBJ7_9BILA|nr:hypothetical protein A3Q56_01230 [Intoshia linei]